MDHDAECRTWNVFHRRHDEGLCCAVPADAPVPRFLFSGDWEFGFAVADGDPPVTGFSPAAARRGAAFNGFHLFLALAARPRAARRTAASGTAAAPGRMRSPAARGGSAGAERGVRAFCPDRAPDRRR